jgi:hypothetical protein
LDIYRLPSITKTLFYLKDIDVWMNHRPLRSCAFTELLTDKSDESVWGFDCIERLKNPDSLISNVIVTSKLYNIYFLSI